MDTLQVGSQCTGVIVANGDSVTLAPPLNSASIVVGISGTWTGTVTFKGTNDGTNYVSSAGNPQPSGSAVSTATANGLWSFDASALTAFQVIATASITGRAVVTITASRGVSETSTSSGTSGVSSFSGDGVLITNSASTGAVTATLGSLPAAQMPALTGDVTTSAGAVATSVVKVNGAAVPTSKAYVGTNGSGQIIDATGVAIVTAQLPVAKYFTTNLASTNTTQASNTFLQNDTYLYAFWLPPGASYTFSNISYSVQTADNTSNSYDLGIYGPITGTGQANVPLVLHIGTTAGTAFAASTGTKTLAITGAPITGIAGGNWYALAITSSGATPAARLGAGPSASFWAPWANGAQIVAGGATLASTITGPTWSFALQNNPIYVSLY